MYALDIPESCRKLIKNDQLLGSYYNGRQIVEDSDYLSEINKAFYKDKYLVKENKIFFVSLSATEIRGPSSVAVVNLQDLQRR